MATTGLHFGSSTVGNVIHDRRARKPTIDVRRALKHAFESLRAVGEGSSWAPGRDWLTRIEDWDHPQTPR